MSILTLKKNLTVIEVAQNGEYQINIKNFCLKNCRPRLICDGEEFPLQNWEISESGTDKILLKTKNESGCWFLEFNLEPDAVSIRLYGELDSPRKNVKIITMHLPRLQAGHVLAQGSKMGACKAGFLANAKEEDFEGFYQLMLTENGSTLQLAFPLRQKQPNVFKGRIGDGCVSELEAVSEIHNFDGRILDTDALTFKCSSNGFKLMEDYGDENVEHPRNIYREEFSGWNSWDYYRWTITEEEVLKNAEFIARDPVLSKYVKRIIVDDGWQYCYGEWEANHYFPNGMKYLADELTKMGFEPGLWFAPTIAEPHSRIAQMDYDMLAMGESGNPCLAFECMKRYGFVLDPTQEKVQNHLKKLFNRYVDMGYKYFKLDFMAQTLNAKKFANTSVPRSEIQRLIVKSIYEAVSAKAKILGCNYIFNGGNAYVDSVRAGGDIHARWLNILHNALSTASRFWTNNRLWQNDPDFALCRAFDTSCDKEINRLQPVWVVVEPEDENPQAGVYQQVDIGRDQSEILLSIVLMSGGAINLSDKMYLLNESGLDLARRTVSAEKGDTAIPLDLFESELPSRWLQKVGNRHRVLLINWKEEPSAAIFELKEYGIESNTALNFWNDTPVKIISGKIENVLAPRSCLLIEIR